MSGFTSLRSSVQLYVTGEGDDKYLIGTAEQPLCALHRGSWMDPKTLSIKCAVYSTCFRKKAGSHGRDTLGRFRVHQLEKVKLFCITSLNGNESWEMFEEMIKNSEYYYMSKDYLEIRCGQKKNYETKDGVRVPEVLQPFMLDTEFLPGGWGTLRRALIRRILRLRYRLWQLKKRMSAQIMHPGMIVRVDGDEFWHMTRVLRLNVNDRIELFDGSGGLVEGTLLRVTKNCAEVVAMTSRHTLPRAGPNWHVAAAFGNLKGGRADWLVEKCTELGAQTLTPLLTQRSATVAEQRKDRWHRISMAATKQCQRLHTLDVREPTRFDSFLAEVRKAEVAFLATAGAPPLVQALLRRSEKPEGGLLLIGPEGDFTPEEIEMLMASGAVPVG